MSFHNKKIKNYDVIVMEESRFDASLVSSFKDHVEKLFENDATQLVIDLGCVNFMDSSGLGAIVAVLKRLNGTGKVLLVDPQPAIKDLFKLTCMDKIFEVYDSLDKALDG